MNTGSIEVAGRLIPHAQARVLRLLVRGLTNGEIAKECGTSASNVAQHVARLCANLKASNRVQLAVLAVRNGIE